MAAKASGEEAREGAAPEQTINYDWLGNTSTTDDDAHGFYDRSLGAITNNTAAGKPYQLVGASNSSKGGSRTGNLAAAYDVAGNLTDMAVTRTSTASLCLPSGAGCNQHLHYQWDEVGRLVRAQRWDIASPSLQTLPTTEAVADLTYTYDASDNRVLKSATAKENNVDVQRHSVYVSGGQELRGAQFGSAYLDAGATGSDYQIDSTTEIAYLFAHGVRLGRVAYDNGAGMPMYSENAVIPAQHVLINLDDTLGSTSIVIDRATSELVESTAYLAHGATESDYRPDRWKGLREDYRFTGKEEDVEVGLQYFGKRFLSPYLGLWMSADPLAVHSPGKADLNLFAYVHGQVLQATDPVGLDDVTQSSLAQEDEQAGMTHADMPAESSMSTSTTSSTVATTGKSTSAPAPTTGPAPSAANDSHETPRTYSNWVARGYAENGYNNVAELAERGLGCSLCHVQHNFNGPPTDNQFDLQNYDRMKTVANVSALGTGILTYIGTTLAEPAAPASPAQPRGLPVPEGLPTNINGPRQALHTPGPTLGPGRSPVTADPQALLDGVHAGEYPIIRLNPRGQPVVDFGQEIGVHVTPGGSQPTQFGTLHSGKNGVHIVPANPTQY